MAAAPSSLREGSIVGPRHLAAVLTAILGLGLATTAVNDGTNALEVFRS